MFAIEGNSSLYIVEIDADGSVECSCEDFFHRGHTMNCKHICFVLYFSGIRPETVLAAVPLTRPQIEMVVENGKRLTKR